MLALIFGLILGSLLGRFLFYCDIDIFHIFRKKSWMEKEMEKYSETWASEDPRHRI